jgi:hypothetical protein
MRSPKLYRCINPSTLHRSSDLNVDEIEFGSEERRRGRSRRSSPFQGEKSDDTMIASSRGSSPFLGERSDDTMIASSRISSPFLGEKADDPRVARSRSSSLSMSTCTLNDGDGENSSVVEDPEEPTRTPRQTDGTSTSKNSSPDRRQVEESDPMDVESTEQRSESDVRREEPPPRQDGDGGPMEAVHLTEGASGSDGGGEDSLMAGVESTNQSADNAKEVQPMAVVETGIPPSDSMDVDREARPSDDQFEAPPELRRSSRISPAKTQPSLKFHASRKVTSGRKKTSSSKPYEVHFKASFRFISTQIYAKKQ